MLVLTALVLIGVGCHPFGTYPLSLRLFARKLPPFVSDHLHAERPSVAICMSAYNEEAVIAGKVDSLIAMAGSYGPATIHIYADAPSDRTAEILSNYGDHIDLVVARERAGKTHGMNTLVARSTSELILFTDANVINDIDALPLLVAPFTDPKIGCASAHLIYSNPTESVTSETGAVYWSLEERIKRIESGTVGLVGVDGAMFMLRRSLHRPPPPMLIDDLYLSLLVLIQGFRLVTVADARVYERSAVLSGEEFERKKRIACQAINVHRALWPELKRMRPLALYGYVSHRLVKWLAPFFFFGAGLSLWLTAFVVLGPSRTLELTAAGLIVWMVGLWLRIRLVSIVSTALVSLAGVATGVIQSICTGRTYTVWSPAASVREDGSVPSSE